MKIKCICGSEDVKKLLPWWSTNPQTGKPMLRVFDYQCQRCGLVIQDGKSY